MLALGSSCTVSLGVNEQLPNVEIVISCSIVLTSIDQVEICAWNEKMTQTRFTQNK